MNKAQYRGMGVGGGAGKHFFRVDQEGSEFGTMGQKPKQGRASHTNIRKVHF